MMVTWGVDEVDEVRFASGALEHEGHGDHLEADAPLLLVQPRVCEAQGPIWVEKLPTQGMCLLD